MSLALSRRLLLTVVWLCCCVEIVFILVNCCLCVGVARVCRHRCVALCSALFVLSVSVVCPSCA